MTIVVPNVGEEFFLDSILAAGYTLRLYTNDVTAGLDDEQIDALVAGYFTEATFAGYSASAITGGTWTTTQADPTVGTNTQRTFTRSSTGTPQTVYGYYVTRTTGGALAWFEPFPGPLTVTNNGDTIRVTPTITLDDDKEATVTARGIVARQRLFTTATDISADGYTDFALADVAVDSSRTYAVHLDTAWTLTGTSRWIGEFRVDGVAAGRLFDETAPSGQLSGQTSGVCVWEPDTGTPDLTIYADEISGTAAARFIGAAGTPRVFWVEDIGPRLA